MKIKKLLAAALLLCSAGAWAQTNLIAGWDGGTDTSSPSNFGWTSSTNRTLNARNASGGVRMTTNYSGYKLENGTSYSYSASSDPSSVIFWVRYGTSGESYTYTFKGLEADSYYDFSALVGWHNNSNAPTLTVALNDGSYTMATMSKKVSDKQKLYEISSRFKTPSTMTTDTDVKLVFTCNQTGDCMEAISALSLVKVNIVLKDDLEAAIAYATMVNSYLSDTDLTTAVTTAQGVYDDADATQTDVNEATSALEAAVTTAINKAPLTFINPGFESCTVTTSNAAAVASAAPLDIAGAWTQTSSAAWSSSAVVEYGGAGQVNGASAPSTDDLGNGGYTLGVSVGWGGAVTYKSVTKTWPAGVYTFKISAYNANSGATQFKSLFGFVPTSGSATLSTKVSFTYGTWETDQVIVTLTEPTEGYIQVGGQAVTDGSGSNAKVFFDNITLIYQDPLSGARTIWEAAKDDAETAKTENPNVTGTELETLNTELAKAEPTTLEGFNAATEAINNAKDALVAAAPAYNAYAEANGIATTLGATGVTAPTSAAEAVTRAQELYLNIDTKVNNTYTFDVTNTYAGDFTGFTATNKGQHWSDDAAKEYLDQWGNGTVTATQDITLPAGNYVLKAVGRAAAGGAAKAYMSANGTTVNFANNGDTGKGVDTSGAVNYGEGTFANENNGRGWEWRFIPVTLTGETTITVNMTLERSSSWGSFCDFTILCDEATYAPFAKQVYDEAMAAAVAYQDVDMFEADKTALNTAITDNTVEEASATVAAYETATTNLNAAAAAAATAVTKYEAYTAAGNAIDAAKALLENHNFVTAEAATAFAEAIAAIEEPYNARTLSADDALAAGTTLGVSAVNYHGARAEADYTPAEAYMKSAGFDAEYNDWSVEGVNDGTNFLVPFFQYWTGDGNSLANKTITSTLTDLPNGLYEVSAWVRVRSKNGVAATDATGITMDVNGGGEGDYAAVDVTEGSQIGEGQFQIGTYTAKGLVKQGTLTLNFNIADANISWLSFKNIMYTKDRDLTPEEAFVPATAEDYEFLNGNLEKYALGFEAGEFAPYNNHNLVQAITAAKAIDQSVENSKESVQAAAEAITSAGGIANETEVNAVYDGSFEADYSGQSGNINPTGWQRVKGAAADGYNVRLMNGTNAGLAATTSGKALFTKQSAYYGYANGYTMPLKANTMYKVTFVYGGWGDCKKDGYVSMAAPDGSAVTLSATDLPVDATNADADVNAWKSYEALFTTGEAGDYVLGLRKKSNDTSGQSQYVYGDIVLVKATAADFKDALEAEIATANALVTANVGDGVFQRPVSAANVLISAISDAQAVDDNAGATIDEVIAATESIKTAVETYNNVELNAPDAAKRYAVTMHDADKDWDGNAITFIVGGRDGEGNYLVKYEAAANANLCQALKFTAVEGKTNTYYISAVNTSGTEQYLTSKTLAYGDGTINDQIRTTDDATKAVEISVKAATGGFKLFNQTGTEIARNSSNPDNGLFPDGNVGSHFTIAETSKPIITINTTAAGWGTVMLPFAQSLPEGVKAYSVSKLKADNEKLVLEEVTALEANKPYIIEGSWKAVLTGDALGKALTITDGLLTGVYEATDAPVGKYVLQKNNDVVGFYQVAEGEQPTVGANRAYLTAPASSEVKAFFLDEGTATAIQSVFSGVAAGEIYDLSGRKLNKLQKGVNIVNGKKVMVK